MVSGLSGSSPDPKRWGSAVNFGFKKLFIYLLSAHPRCFHPAFSEASGAVGSRGAQVYRTSDRGDVAAYKLFYSPLGEISGV